jgi:hypothetical protein
MLLLIVATGVAIHGYVAVLIQEFTFLRMPMTCIDEQNMGVVHQME